MPSSKVQLIIVDPPSTKANVSEVVPLIVPVQLSVVVGIVNVPLQSTVTGFRIGVIGFILSSTVTEDVQVKLSELSVIVTVTGVPISAQVKLDMSKEKFGPTFEGSISLGVIVILPDASK